MGRQRRGEIERSRQLEMQRWMNVLAEAIEPRRSAASAAKGAALPDDLAESVYRVLKLAVNIDPSIALHLIVRSNLDLDLDRDADQILTEILAGTDKDIADDLSKLSSESGLDWARDLFHELTRSKQASPLQKDHVPYDSVVPTVVASRLLHTATAVLPVQHQARYFEEFDAQLHELARHGAPRRTQLAYSMSVTLGVPSLRRALRAKLPGWGSQ